MKKLFTLILILISTSILPQTVNYTEGPGVIFNPERGLQKYSISSSGLLSATTLNSWKNSPDRISVVYRYFMLPISGNITSTQLSNIQTDFNTVRNTGLKIIVRFSYSNSCNSGCLDGTISQQPSKNQILTHINQLSPVINNNKDVIFSIQVGFIGTWGEWYYTGSSEFGHAGSISSTQWQNRKDVVDAMLSNFHTDIPLQVRYASAKRQMYGNSIPTNFNQDRIGFYNDAFLNSWGDMGTYSVSGQFTNPVGSNDYNFISNTSRFLPMTGETNGLNPPRTDASNALFELNALNFTTLNRDYNQNVWNGWISSGIYNDILRNLGYRIVLNSASLNNNTLTISLSNKGYGNILFEKRLFLVFRQNGVDTKRMVNHNVRGWTKGNHQVLIEIPQDIADGTYELLLQAADKNLDNPNYSIQFANTGLWEQTTGFNRLNLNYVKTSVPIVIEPEPVVCNPTRINSLSFTQITSTQFRVSWINVPNATYILRISRHQGQPVWTESPTDVPTLLITGLQPNTSYRLGIKTICPTTQSTWSGNFSITTRRVNQRTINFTEEKQIVVQGNYILTNFEYRNIEILDITGRLISSNNFIPIKNGIILVKIDGELYKLIKK
jgi:hypothetical protein